MLFFMSINSLLFPLFYSDSIDTVAALHQMQALVKLANIYIGQCKQNEQTPNHSVLRGIAKYLTRMLKVFGANEGDQEIGFSAGGSAAANVSSSSISFSANSTYNCTIKTLQANKF